MSFTISELREMFDLPYLRFSSDVDVLLREINRDIDLWRHDRANRRLFQLLLDKLQTGDARTVTAEHTQEKCWSLDFFMRPTLISGTGRVHNVTFQKTDLVKEIPIGRSYRQRAIIDTPDTLKRQYELIVTCCGFEATNNLGLPIDEHGAIKNCNGRVQDLSGVYSCGWAATGAVGDLSSTLINSRMVADAILSDLSNIQPTKSTGDFEDFLRKKGIKFDCYE